MFRQVQAEQTDDPEDGETHNWREQELGMVEERKGIVAEEGDDKVVSKGHQVQEVAEEQRDPVVARDDWHEQELDDVQPDPDREEGTNRDVEAISKLQLLNRIVARRAKQASSFVPAWQTLDTRTQ